MILLFFKEWFWMIPRTLNIPNASRTVSNRFFRDSHSTTLKIGCIHPLYLGKIKDNSPN